ncbi:MAG: transcription elongation factor GreAB [Methylotenera sp.]|nr:transcription elongation factor GreAB [Methylotenera sp.]
MSRGFVKEDDLELAGTDLPERPISALPNYVTAAGLAQLKAQAEALENEHRALSANKEDPMAQQKLGAIERDLRYLEARLESATLTQPDPNADHVVFGAMVSVEDEAGQTLQFAIVGEDEADIHANKVSWSSPLAKALIGHKVGDEVTWVRPAGNTKLVITAIQY